MFPAIAVGSAGGTTKQLSPPTLETSWKIRPFIFKFCNWLPVATWVVPGQTSFTPLGLKSAIWLRMPAGDVQMSCSNLLRAPQTWSVTRADTAAEEPSSNNLIISLYVQWCWRLVEVYDSCVIVICSAKWPSLSSLSQANSTTAPSSWLFATMDFSYIGSSPFGTETEEGRSSCYMLP